MSIWVVGFTQTLLLSFNGEHNRSLIDDTTFPPPAHHSATLSFHHATCNDARILILQQTNNKSWTSTLERLTR